VKNDPWSGILHESAFAKPCAQNQSQQGPASTNEDCLYLNVWTPSPAATKAPVMVWIHGGGNFAGSAGDLLPGPPAGEQPLWYDGRSSRPGRHRDRVDELPARASRLLFPIRASARRLPMGNRGLLDQHMVLEWVKDNIAAFGGDPAGHHLR
jgi:para-nitrobenzyl esterase